MTVILGCEHRGKVYLIGDRFSGSDEIADLSDEPKVYKLDVPTPGGDILEIGIGAAGAYRTDHLLKGKLKFPSLPKNPEEYDNWVRLKLSLTISDLFINDAALSTKKSEEQGAHTGGSEFLIGFAGKLYVFQEDMSMCRSSRGYNAVGAGTSMVITAWELAKDWPNIDIKKKLRKAIGAVGKCHPLVSEPYDIISV